MARPPALTTVSSQLAKTLTSAEELYRAVKRFGDGTRDSINGREALFPGQARRVVALAFLQSVIGWEDFVEAVFVRYLAGAESPAKYRPSLRLTAAKSLSHAFQLASGDPDYDPQKHYISWNKWKSVESLAKVFLDAGRPFTNITEQEKQRLGDCVVIRNRIAHNSLKCKSHFIEVSKTHLGLPATGKLAQGFSPGQLLLTSSNRLFGKNAPVKPFFEHYLDTIRSCSNRICPQ